MKKLVLAAVVVLAVMGLAAASFATTGTDDELVRQDNPHAVVSEHIDALNHCDVDRLLAQYPDTVHIILPGVTVEGRHDVRKLFEGFCLPFEEGGLKGLQFTEVGLWSVDETLNMQWEADADFLCEPYLGADAYETKDGLMGAQVTTFDGAELVTVDANGKCPQDVATLLGGGFGF